MKQTSVIISTYTADVMGVCSALYELGGMVIMHDASGCNSTYNTHDEPRWYDMNSMVYISGLSEMEAIMGDDNKLVHDICKAAAELHPRFIAIAGTPIPMMIGTDFEALSSLIEEKTGIPTFGFNTNSMHSYIHGAGMALDAIAKRFVKPSAAGSKAESPSALESQPAINILGLTPLDFSVNGSAESIRAWLQKAGFRVVSSWAMGSPLDELCAAANADVNLVVSACGMAAAKTLRERFGTPWVAGIPYGKKFSDQLSESLRQAIHTKENKVMCARRPASNPRAPELTIIGESIHAGSLAAATNEEFALQARVLCPVEAEEELLLASDSTAADEEDIAAALQGSRRVIADPLYQPICPKESAFIRLPHEAFSGRIFRKEIPNLIENFSNYFEGEFK